MSRRLPSALGALLAGAALGLVLSGCTPIVAMQPAAEAADPACAEVTVRLPDEIGEGSVVLQQRETNAQATGAWGDPVVVLLHCGVDSPAPNSELPCVTVPGGSVDWLVDDSEAPIYRFTAYGRTPSVSVAVDYDSVSGTTVLDAIDAAVSRLPSDGACIGIDEALGEE